MHIRDMAIPAGLLSFLPMLIAAASGLPAQSRQLLPASNSQPSASDFNFASFSAACANGSKALLRWEAQETARITFQRAHGAGVLDSAPAVLDSAGCARLPGPETRLPLDVVVDSHYYAARLFAGQFGNRRASRDEVLDALAAEIWSNLMPEDFRSDYGQSQMLAVRSLLSGSRWHGSYDHARFAHDVYHFYHRHWRRALLPGLLRDEDADGCLSLREFARSLCLQQRYMAGALARTGRRTRALSRVVRKLRFYRQLATA